MGGAQSWLKSVEEFLPFREAKTWIAFADGKRSGTDGQICTEQRALRGSVTLMANVSWGTEYVSWMTIDALPLAVPSRIEPEDKIVIRIDADGSHVYVILASQNDERRSSRSGS